MIRSIMRLLVVLSVFAGCECGRRERSPSPSVMENIVARLPEPIAPSEERPSVGKRTATGSVCSPVYLSGLATLRTAYVGYVPSVLAVSVADDTPVALIVVLMPTILPGQPITVTATRGRERETPVTFSTLEERSLRERHTVQDIPALLAELPSTTYYSESGNGIGYTYLNIRGFDARRIAVMVNGIPQNDPEDHNVYWLDFPDLAGSAEDIQVQRGAGSSFYGPPAIGGSVNLVTSHLGRERSLSLTAGIGSYNTRKYSAAFSSGLVDNRYAMHARLSKILSSGYRDRAWSDFNSYFLGFARYDETMTTQVHLYGGPISDGLAYYGIPKADVQDRDRRRSESDRPSRRDREFLTTALRTAARMASDAGVDTEHLGVPGAGGRVLRL